jgi:hypothetical protein
MGKHWRRALLRALRRNSRDGESVALCSCRACGCVALMRKVPQISRSKLVLRGVVAFLRVSRFFLAKVLAKHVVEASNYDTYLLQIHTRARRKRSQAGRATSARHKGSSWRVMRATWSMMTSLPRWMVSRSPTHPPARPRPRHVPTDHELC